MRIGTWNLQGRWIPRHLDLMLAMDCDVWLLTEVNERVSLPEHTIAMSAASMASKRRWSAVASRLGIERQADPHPASTMATIEGLVFCSSVLPWRSCGTALPWGTGNLAERTARCVTDIAACLPPATSVWGGDWNHATVGREHSGSRAGRAKILHAVDLLGLDVPTALLAHRIGGCVSIDHVAVPRGGVLDEVRRVVASHDGRRLSDHDAYVVAWDRSAQPTA